MRRARLGLHFDFHFNLKAFVNKFQQEMVFLQLQSLHANIWFERHSCYILLYIKFSQGRSKCYENDIWVQNLMILNNHAHNNLYIYIVLQGKKVNNWIEVEPK